ncbi:MAG: ABC transporter ATP-binding protein [bacterium]|nr:ABC transporter ATP-binding protein [bacterium]
MDREIAIKIENLSKRYRIGEQLPYRTLRDEIVKFISTPFKKTFKREGEINYIWALKNVSLEIMKGEVIGIIGRNGAGKTTLLKILSRITKPTYGYVEIRGRVGSLLEVGTGFHPELTGRENIYLNAAILGMRKKEIDRKFDDIVSFAEIGKFLDTPVKRYSAGMYVRLAFSVAAYLEPEILLVDEVLAVGDIAFQRKCLGKMGEVAKEGRTVLFVSHNMSAVRGLCNKVMWIEKGEIKKTGNSDEITREYEEAFIQKYGGISSLRIRDKEEIRNKKFYFVKTELFDEEGNPRIGFKYNEKIILSVHLEGEIEEKYHIVFRIYDKNGIMIFSGASAELHNKYFETEVMNLRIEIGPTNLTIGNYRIELVLRKGRIQSGDRDEIDIWEDAMNFEITDCRPFETNWELQNPRDGIYIIPNRFFD